MPPWPQLRTRKVTIRLTIREYVRLKEAAKQFKLSISEYVRRLAL